MSRMEMPPTRYRVEERGRRLVVIDTHRGVPISGLPPESQARIDRLSAALGGRARPAPPAPARPLPPTAAPRPRASGSAEPGNQFVTRPWFDSKAPRTIRLNYAVTEQLKQARIVIAIFIAFAVGFTYLLWPISLGLWFLLFALPGGRGAIRIVGTQWIDSIDQDAAASSSVG